MKVVQINSVCGIGSTGRIATDIHNILIKKGHESYIGYGRDLPKNCNNAVKIGSKFDNYTHIANTRIFDKHGFGSKQATLEFIEEVKEINPDIIHLHNIHGYYVNIEILFDYLKEANKPVVWTLHDCWSFTGHCAYFDYAGCDKWKAGCHNCPEKSAYPSSLLLDNSKNNYERKKKIFNGVNNLTIVTPSRWLASLVQESFLKRYPTKVINNGIDLTTFTPRENRLREIHNIDNKFIILGVANIWDRRKGLEDFVKLSRLLDGNFIIILIGLSDKQINGLPDNIIGIKKTNNIDELAEWYSTADIFFNPTYEDNYPTTNLEALACGTKVITYYTGGSYEVIDNKNGYVTSKGDVNYVKDIIINYRKKNKGHKTIEHNVLDKSEVSLNYITLYEKLMR